MTNAWKEYYNGLETRLNTMWNFMLYNQFVNEQINNLQENNERIKNENLELQKKYTDIIFKNLEEKDKYNKLYEENDALKKQIIGNKSMHKRKRPREPDLKELEIKNNNKSWITKVKKSIPKRYKFMDIEERDELLSQIFRKLNSIKDIINLKNIESLYDYLKLPKFEKIYKLIPSLEELDKLIGLESLKEQVFKMICYFIHNLENKEELNHIVITGPPGVGKTTIAKLLGNIYSNLDFLKNDKFFKARRSDLIAEYTGQTAIKTQKVIDNAEGGVLFIDEVYSLGNPEKRDTFAKECIDTINLNLTEKSDKLLVIVAGYKDDVQTCFFNYNSGLERRFPLRFEIEKYSKEDLYNILIKFIDSENWEVNGEIKDLIYDNYDLFKFMGGDMMTIFKYAKEQLSIRLMKSQIYIENTKELLRDDFKYAVNKFKISRLNKNEEIPHNVRGMYL